MKFPVNRLQKVAASLAYHGVCTEGNYPGQRQRFLRNLSTQEWVALYGKRYLYTADHIHAHPAAYRRSTRVLARVANLLEECGEIMQRTTTWHMRFTGSIVPATLRDVCGKGRFCDRLRRAAMALDGTASAGAIGSRRHLLSTYLQDPVLLERLYGALRAKSILNARSQLTCDLRSGDSRRQLIQVLEATVLPAGTQADPSLVCALAQALGKADMRRHWVALSARKRAAYVVGSCWSIATQLGINSLLLLVSSSLLASVVGKTLAVSSMLYGVSFLLRIAVTVQARLMRSHRGYGRAFPVPVYRSLSEKCLARTRAFRNRCYVRMGVSLPVGRPLPVDVHGLQLDPSEFRSASFAVHGRAGMAGRTERYFARTAVDGVQRVTDVLYSADSVSSRLLGRLFRRLFCAADGFRQVAGQTAGGQAQFDWYVPAARHARLGAARLAVARLIGIHGAETLGACVACFMVSAAWTVISKFSGGLGVLFMIGGGSAILPVSSAIIGASGWALSLLMDVARRSILRVSTYPDGHGTFRGADATH